VDPLTIALLGGSIVQGLGSLWGAGSQSATNNANLQAQIQHNNLIQAYVNQLMQPGTSPYAQMIMQFIGGQALGYPGMQLPGAAYYGQQPVGNGTNLPFGSGGAPNGWTPGSLGIPNLGLGDWTNWTPPGGWGGSTVTTGGTPTYIGVQPTALDASGGAGGAGGVDSLEAYRTQLLAMTPEQRIAEYNRQIAANPSLTYAPGDTSLAAQQFNLLYGVTGGGTGNINYVSGPQAIPQAGINYLLNPNAQTYAAYQQLVTANQGRNPNALPAGYQQNIFQPTGSQAGNPIDNFPSSGPVGAGTAGGGMYRYTPLAHGFTYNANLLGTAPQVNASPVQFNPSFAGAQSAAPGQMQAALVAPNAFGKLGGTQGFNQGQDGLLQMMRREIGLQQDPSLALNLQQINAGNSQFDNSQLFKALQATDDPALQRQVDQLHASAGSLGARFGTAMQRNEAELRGNFAAAAQARNAQIAQQSFEAAQARRLQGLGLTGQLQDQTNQFGLANAGLQLQAGQAAGGLERSGQQLQLQSGQFDIGNQLQAALANQASQNATQQFNIGNTLQNQQFNAANQQQAGLANQALLAQLLPGARQNSLQAQLANQNVLAQYGLANQTALNNAGQFNAGMNMQQNQFNAQQGNIYNQLILSALGQANQSQLAQNQYNAGLVGILNGLGVPQQQLSPWPGAIADLGGTAMSLPLLYQFMNQNNRTTSGYSNNNLWRG